MAVTPDGLLVEGTEKIKSELKALLLPVMRIVIDSNLKSQGGITLFFQEKINEALLNPRISELFETLSKCLSITEFNKFRDELCSPYGDLTKQALETRFEIIHITAKSNRSGVLKSGDHDKKDQAESLSRSRASSISSMSSYGMVEESLLLSQGVDSPVITGITAPPEDPNPGEKPSLGIQLTAQLSALQDTAASTLLSRSSSQSSSSQSTSSSMLSSLSSILPTSTTSVLLRMMSFHSGSASHPEKPSPDNSPLLTSSSIVSQVGQPSLTLEKEQDRKTLQEFEVSRIEEGTSSRKRSASRSSEHSDSSFVKLTPPPSQSRRPSIASDISGFSEGVLVSEPNSRSGSPTSSPPSIGAQVEPFSIPPLNVSLLPGSERQSKPIQDQYPSVRSISLVSTEKKEISESISLKSTQAAQIEESGVEENLSAGSPDLSDDMSSDSETSTIKISLSRTLPTQDILKHPDSGSRKKSVSFAPILVDPKRGGGVSQKYHSPQVGSKNLISTFASSPPSPPLGSSISSLYYSPQINSSKKLFQTTAAPGAKIVSSRRNSLGSEIWGFSDYDLMQEDLLTGGSPPHQSPLPLGETLRVTPSSEVGELTELNLASRDLAYRKLKESNPSKEQEQKISQELELSQVDEESSKGLHFDFEPLPETDLGRSSPFLMITPPAGLESRRLFSGAVFIPKPSEIISSGAETAKTGMPLEKTPLTQNLRSSDVLSALPNPSPSQRKLIRLALRRTPGHVASASSRSTGSSPVVGNSPLPLASRSLSQPELPQSEEDLALISGTRIEESSPLRRDSISSNLSDFEHISHKDFLLVEESGGLAAGGSQPGSGNSLESSAGIDPKKEESSRASSINNSPVLVSHSGVSPSGRVELNLSGAIPPPQSRRSSNVSEMSEGVVVSRPNSRTGLPIDTEEDVTLEPGIRSESQASDRSYVSVHALPQSRRESTTSQGSDFIRVSRDSSPTLTTRPLINKPLAPGLVVKDTKIDLEETQIKEAQQKVREEEIQRRAIEEDTRQREEEAQLKAIEDARQREEESRARAQSRFDSHRFILVTDAQERLRVIQAAQQGISSLGLEQQEAAYYQNLLSQAQITAEAAIALIEQEQRQEKQRQHDKKYQYDQDLAVQLQVSEQVQELTSALIESQQALEGVAQATQLEQSRVQLPLPVESPILTQYRSTTFTNPQEEARVLTNIPKNEMQANPALIHRLCTLYGC